MNWNRNRSVRLSQACLVLFAAALAALDIGGYWIVGYMMEIVRGLEFWQQGAVVLAAVYCGSVPAWILLASLWGLLGRLRRGLVFDAANVRLMRRASWCCCAAGAISLLAGCFWLPLLMVSLAAFFVGLVVRIVKNAFEQAIAMKDELDWTV